MSDGDIVSIEDAPEAGPIGKMQNSLCTMCGGIILFPVFLFVLGWNEKHFVCRGAQIMYANSNAEVIPSSACSASTASKPWKDYEDKFAFFSCGVEESKQHSWSPSDFGGDASLDVVKFNSPTAAQQVEMYQCIETKSTTTTGSGKDRKKVTKYSYKMGWSSTSEPITSGKTPSENDCPYYSKAGGNPAFSISAGSKTAEQAQVGPFNVDQTLASRFSASATVGLTSYRDSFKISTIPNPSTLTNFYMTATSSTLQVDTSGSGLETCPGQIFIGCLRIGYKKSSADKASVLGKMGDGGLVGPQDTPSSWGCSASDMEELYTEELTKDEMIEKLKSSNSATLWLLRLVGVLGAWAAVYCCFAPIAAGADVVGDFLSYIPCVGDALENFVEGVVTAILCVMSCGIGCSCAFFVIAVVWVVMRPMVGGIMLAVAVVLMVAVVVVRRQHEVPEGRRRRKKKALLEGNEAEEA